MDAFHTFLSKIESEILTPIVTVLILVGFLLVVWGVVNFIRNAGDAKKRAEGQQQMIWGIIGLAIMFGATALVMLLKNIVAGIAG